MVSAWSTILLLPGKTEEFKQMVAEVTGPRKGEYEDMLRRSGMTRMFYTLQSTPMGDFVALYLEANDPNAVTSRIINSDHPFDRWFYETVLNGMHGIDSSQEPPPPNEVMFDWHA